jgi:hypothetical protein
MEPHIENEVPSAKCVCHSVSNTVSEGENTCPQVSTDDQSQIQSAERLSSVKAYTVRTWVDIKIESCPLRSCSLPISVSEALMGICVSGPSPKLAVCSAFCSAL